ncbi:hypothetical protein LUZ60_014555 [Juncus effusus]|nr:hypothetical protein LUZ60_014555 [Juncus effusus]
MKTRFFNKPSPRFNLPSHSHSHSFSKHRNKPTKALITSLFPSINRPHTSRHFMGPTTPAAAGDDGGGAAYLRRPLNLILFLVFVLFPCAVLYCRAVAPAGPTADRSVGFLPVVVPAADPIDISQLDSEDARLNQILKSAATETKTVILTTLNSAWSAPNSVIDLFIESFRTGINTRNLLDHLIIVALDMEAYTRCVLIHAHCFVLITDGVDFSGQKDFLSDGYLKMMWRRIDFLRVVLEKGYNFIFSDADIMWFRNPIPNFHPKADFQIACDHFTGNSTDLNNRPNGGFNYVKSNNKTIQFYKYWYDSQFRFPGNHDQDVLNLIKHDPFLTEIGIEIRFLSTEYFGGICEPSRDFGKVCTMHANCCIGLESKINDLRVMLEDWRSYMSLRPEVKQSGHFSWQVPQNCSLDALKNKHTL